MTFWPLWTQIENWANNFCRDYLADVYAWVTWSYHVICRRNSIFGENDLFNPCDPCVTIDPKLVMSQVCILKLVIVTKTGQSRMQHVWHISMKKKLDVTVSPEVTPILLAFAVTPNHLQPYIRDLKLMYICKSRDCAALHWQFKDSFVVKTNIWPLCPQMIPGWLLTP